MVPYNNNYFKKKLIKWTNNSALFKNSKIDNMNKTKKKPNKKKM